MPTGYTSQACEHDVPFEEFVWSCARAMGALIMMRDDGHDAPIPERFEPSDYHTKALAEAKERLARLKKMSLRQAADEAKKERDEIASRRQEALKRAQAVNSRLTKLRSQVADWHPPTADHVNFKEFMLEQLDTTIQHDGTVSSYYDEELSKNAKAPEDWLREAIEAAEGNIEYHTKHHKEEVERTEARNKWLADLRASVPYMPPKKRS